MLNIGLSELVTESARGLCSVCSTSIVPRTVCIAAVVVAVVVRLLQLPRALHAQQGSLPRRSANPAALPAYGVRGKGGGGPALVLNRVWCLIGILL